MNVWQFIAQNSDQVLHLTLEHLWLAGVSTFLAALVAIPLGIPISRKPIWNKPILGSAEHYLQTIPSLAPFGFLLPAPWIGERADRLAILALALYAPSTDSQHVCRNKRCRSCSNRGRTWNGHD